MRMNFYPAMQFVTNSFKWSNFFFVLFSHKIYLILFYFFAQAHKKNSFPDATVIYLFFFFLSFM